MTPLGYVDRNYYINNKDPNAIKTRNFKIFKLIYQCYSKHYLTDKIQYYSVYRLT